MYVNEPVVGLVDIDSIKEQALEVINGNYDTGVAPLRQWGSVDEGGLVKIDQAHRSNNVLSELVRNKNIARWASEVTRSNTIQVWATQLFYKPSSVKDNANVGWHTDSQYWDFWQGEVFTIWIALTESTALTGPLRFLQGSHLNPKVNVGDALCSDIDTQKSALPNELGIDRQEVSSPLSAGGISIHHANVYHASGGKCFRSAEVESSDSCKN